MPISPSLSVYTTHMVNVNCHYIYNYVFILGKTKVTFLSHFSNKYVRCGFCQIEIVLKDSTAFVYVTKSEKSSH